MKSLVECVVAVRQAVIQVRHSLHSKPLNDTSPDGIPREGRNDASATNVQRALWGDIVRVLSSDPSSLDAASKHEVVTTPGVVGTNVVVWRKRSGEVGRDNYRRLVPHARSLQLVHYLGQPKVQRL